MSRHSIEDDASIDARWRMYVARVGGEEFTQAATSAMSCDAVQCDMTYRERLLLHECCEAVLTRYFLDDLQSRTNSY